MGQIIKIYDYISRYEQNIYNYPARFITLKRKQWDHLKKDWESGIFIPLRVEENNERFEGNEQRESKSRLRRFADLIRRKDKNQIENMENNNFCGGNELVQSDTLTELKTYFLDEIFQIQLSWASSTLQQKSFIDRSFLNEWQLRFFAQRFPDTFLFLYKPVFQLKKARIEAETILITPAETFCLTFLEEDRDTVYLGSEKRFWEIRVYKRSKKIINPTLALNRTEKIVNSILHHRNIQFPITKVLIARDGFIDYPFAPYDLTIVDKRNFDEWFKDLRAFRSPLKHDQLRVADALLSFCRTQATFRTNWSQGVYPTF